jgi:hypothetical protein
MLEMNDSSGEILTSFIELDEILFKKDRLYK